MKKKKVHRGIMSFDIATGRVTATFDSIGIQIGKPAMDEPSKKTIRASFGLFGGNSDSNKYYTDIKGAADVAPKPEDFAEVPFRLLSATVVGAYSWKATDFSNAKILEASMSKLEGKPVYKNHDTETDNWVGLVKEVKWTPSFTNAAGEAIPAGIDGVLMLDAKTNPKMVRGVLLGAIHSNSVTVEFDWEASHDMASDEEFARSVGKMVKGEMVRRKVTQIYNYHETSLVFLGADPFAKLLTSAGDLARVDTASVYYEKADATQLSTFEKDKKYAIEFGLNEKIISLSKDSFSKPTSKPEKTQPMNKELLAFICAFLALPVGTDEATATAEFAKTGGTLLEKHNTALAKAACLDKIVSELEVVELAKPETTKVTLTSANALPDTFKPAEYQLVKKTEVVAAKEATTKVVTLTGEVAALTTEKTGLAKMAAEGEKFIGQKRTEAIRLYKLATGDKASTAVEELFKNADADALEGLLNQYTKGVSVKFSGKCKKCDSTEFEFRSSLESGEEKADTGSTEALSGEDIYNKYASKNMNIAKSSESAKK